MKLVAGAVAMLVMLSGCSSSGLSITNRAVLHDYLEKSPGVPLVLPTTLPPKADFFGPGSRNTQNQRTVSTRSIVFRIGGSEIKQVIEICVTEPGRPASTCVPPGGTAQAIRRTQGGYPVWIRARGSDPLAPEERAFWTEVPLSDDLDAITWLD